VDLNDRPMRAYGASRRQLFERIDRPALRPLPTERFEFATWKLAKVHIDYHVEFEHHYYSVPFGHVHEHVEMRVTDATVEVFLRGLRIASHRRSVERGKHTTQVEHMPKSHRKHAEWSPARLCAWANTIGPNTETLVRAILEDRPHPEQGYRSCLGILRLARHYGEARLEAACIRAVAVRARSYRNVEAILKNGLDRIAMRVPDGGDESPRPTHENIRGRGYYH
jgi:transposase